MGVVRALRIMAGVPEMDEQHELAAAVYPPQLPIIQLASPFGGQPSHLNTIVWADLLDANRVPCTRTEAMGIPAIAKSRHVVAPKVAGTPLRQIKFNADTRQDEPQPDPYWASRTDDGISPWHRMLWTTDDLIFSGWSCWLTRRGTANELLAVSRLGMSRWSFDSDSNVVIDGKIPSNPSSYILIPGPHEGILNFGRTAIRHAAQVLRAATVAASTPNAQTELHQTDPTITLTDPEKQALRDDWVAARRGENGGVAFTSPGIEVKDHGSVEGALLIDGRNASAVDCARLVGVSAGMIDATAPKASLNYETTQGRGLENIEYGVEPYMDAIAARLSLDDVVPRGHRIRFDIAENLGPVEPTGPTVED